MSGWVELKGFQDIADAQVAKWEIEVKDWTSGLWEAWLGVCWDNGTEYRGRPRQPKTRTVTSWCWRNINDGMLMWRTEEHVPLSAYWQRFPAGDITGEVEE